MKNLVFFLEGHSEKALLERLLPRFFVSQEKIIPHFIVFRGKHDLENKLYDRLKGWCQPNSFFVLLVDQDEEDCYQLKKRLIVVCQKTDHFNHCLIRIACHELESWYFGDLPAVQKALSDRLERYQEKRKYRNPDNIHNPAKELSKITKGKYNKISGSKAIGQHLSFKDNKSPSFNHFINGIQKLLQINVEMPQH